MFWRSDHLQECHPLSVMFSECPFFTQTIISLDWNRMYKIMVTFELAVYEIQKMHYNNLA